MEHLPPMYPQDRCICRTRDRRYRANYVQALAKESQTRPAVQTAGYANTFPRVACVSFWETVFYEADPAQDQRGTKSRKSAFRKLYLRPLISQIHKALCDIAYYSAPPAANLSGKRLMRLGRSSSSYQGYIAPSTALYRFSLFETRSNARLTVRQKRTVSANEAFRIVFFSYPIPIHSRQILMALVKTVSCSPRMMPSAIISNPANKKQEGMIQFLCFITDLPTRCQLFSSTGSCSLRQNSGHRSDCRFRPQKWFLAQLALRSGTPDSVVSTVADADNPHRWFQ